ncbi:MAG: HAD family hydrolase [Paludibacter sp.]|nr:HAD family hydrolase [Paludibacter sp.]
MIIAIDFDGTIVQSNFPSIGALIPNAKESINKLFQDGHYIIIWTCRQNEQLLDMFNFLVAENILFHRCNDNSPEQTAKYGTNSRKVYAHAYIDDLAIGCPKTSDNLPDWLEIYQQITAAETNYQNKMAEIQTFNPKNLINLSCLRPLTINH